MDLTIVRWIQTLRNPVLDWFFYLVTQLGDQIVFIAVAVILYWTVSKKFAHKFVFAFLISAIVNTGLKQLFKRLRPYNFSGVVSLDHWTTTGYSFPSGHAQAAGVIGYASMQGYKQTSLKWLKYVSLFVLILVPLSRVYLGQHYLSDVIVGVLLAYALAHVAFLIVDKMGNDEHVYTLMLAPVMIIFLLFFPIHDVAIAAGGFVGFAGGYYLEKVYVKYEVKAVYWIQIVKVVFGLIIAFAIKEGFKLFFPDTVFFDFIRYFLIGGWAAVGAPLAFKYGQKHLQKKI